MIDRKILGLRGSKIENQKSRFTLTSHNRLPYTLLCRLMDCNFARYYCVGFVVAKRRHSQLWRRCRYVFDSHVQPQNNINGSQRSLHTFDLNKYECKATFTKKISRPCNQYWVRIIAIARTCVISESQILMNIRIRTKVGALVPIYDPVWSTPAMQEFLNYTAIHVRRITQYHRLSQQQLSFLFSFAVSPVNTKLLDC